MTVSSTTSRWAYTTAAGVLSYAYDNRVFGDADLTGSASDDAGNLSAK